MKKPNENIYFGGTNILTATLGSPAFVECGSEWLLYKGNCVVNFAEHFNENNLNALSPRRRRV